MFRTALPLAALLAACATTTEPGVSTTPQTELADAVLGQTSEEPAEDVGGLRLAALTISVTSMIPGDATTFTVMGANPGETIHFVRSSAGVGAGPCLGTAALLCLDITSPTLHATVTADANGVATLTQTLPLTLPIGADVWFQAIAPRGLSGASWVKSGTFANTIGNAPLTVPGMVYGDLVITEIMQNPDAVLDNNGEWFEVRNNSGLDMNLSGLQVTDFGLDTFTVAGNLFVSAGERLVFVRNGDPGINGGINGDYDYAGAMSLGNGVDELHVVAPFGIIDSVAWDDGLTFPDPVGASMELSSVHVDDPDANDAGVSWYEGRWAYGLGDLGSPGSEGPDACDSLTEVLYNDRCYYLDGSGGACLPGYELAPQSVLNTIAGDFVGLDYKTTISDNCCIDHADSAVELQDWGMDSNCNSSGPFTSAPVMGGAGCSNSNNHDPNQLTLCQSI